jgi:hypothetical protein
MIRLALTVAVLAAFAVPALAQPTQVKVGQCPSGYASEANYCVEMRRR